MLGIMARDDEFDGTTYVSHSDDTVDSDVSTDASGGKEDTSAPVDQASIEARLAALEEDFALYKEQTEKKFRIIEKIAKKQSLSSSERIFMIQEEV